MMKLSFSVILCLAYCMPCTSAKDEKHGLALPCALNEVQPGKSYMIV